MKSKSTSHDADVVVFSYKRAGSGASSTSWLSKEEALDTEKPISLKTAIQRVVCTKSKGSPYGQFEITLKPTQNWMRKLIAGSWCVIYMKTTKLAPEDYRAPASVADDNSCPLKMIGVIMSVRERLTVDPEGRQAVWYTVSGFDFGYMLTSTILINSMFYGSSSNPEVQSALEVMFTTMDPEVNQVVFSPDKNVRNVLNMIDKLQDSLGGSVATLSNSALSFAKQSTALTPKTQKQFDSFTSKLEVKIDKVPENKAFLPSPAAPFFKDVASNTSFVNGLTLALGFDNRQGNDKDVKSVSGELLGKKAFYPQSVISSSTIWELLMEHSNSVINELIVDLMVSNGKLVPTLMLRQIPFTTDAYPKNMEVKGFNAPMHQCSRYSKLTRNVVSDVMLIGYDMGCSEHERVTYVELLGRLFGCDRQTSTALWASENPPIADVGPIQRLGMRAMIRRELDYAALSDNWHEAITWTPLVADWWFNSHLFANGTFDFIGLDQNIALGENLEIKEKRILGHIEGYSHSFEVDQSIGVGIFRTSVTLTKITHLSDSGEVIFFSGSMQDQPHEFQDEQDSNDQYTANRVYTNERPK